MTTTEVEADAAVAESGKPVKSKNARQSGTDLIDQLVAQTRAQGLELTGEGGLLQQLTKRVLESALEGEITDHLGYDKHDLAGKDSGNWSAPGWVEALIPGRVRGYGTPEEVLR